MNRMLPILDKKTLINEYEKNNHYSIFMLPA